MQEMYKTFACTVIYIFLVFFFSLMITQKRLKHVTDNNVCKTKYKCIILNSILIKEKIRY
jgi:hypothetical protein